MTNPPAVPSRLGPLFFSAEGVDVDARGRPKALKELIGDRTDATSDSPHAAFTEQTNMSSLVIW